MNGVAVARLENVLSERYRSRGPVAFRIPAVRARARSPLDGAQCVGLAVAVADLFDADALRGE